MAFHPNMTDYPFKVVATDAKRPGWSFIWGGCQLKGEAEDMVKRFHEQPGTEHLTFTIRFDSCEDAGRFGRSANGHQ